MALHVPEARLVLGAQQRQPLRLRQREPPRRHRHGLRRRRRVRTLRHHRCGLRRASPFMPNRLGLSSLCGGVGRRLGGLAVIQVGRARSAGHRDGSVRALSAGPRAGGGCARTLPSSSAVDLRPAARLAQVERASSVCAHAASNEKACRRGYGLHVIRGAGCARLSRARAAGTAPGVRSALRSI